MSSLRQCPFCGTRNLHIQKTPSNDGTIIWHKIMHDPTIDCGASALNSNEEDLVNNWNKRIFEVQIPIFPEYLRQRGFINKTEPINDFVKGNVLVRVFSTHQHKSDFVCEVWVIKGSELELFDTPIYFTDHFEVIMNDLKQELIN